MPKYVVWFGWSQDCLFRRANGDMRVKVKLESDHRRPTWPKQKESDFKPLLKTALYLHKVIKVIHTY